MPTKPTPVVMTASGMDVFNTIRERDMNPQFQALVPYGTNANSREIGAALYQYQWAKNDFLSALVNRIGRVMLTSKLYENPWAFFKKGMMEFGETVEEIFVNICRVQDYDPVVAETELYKRRIPDVRAAFHQMNYQKFYPATVSDDQLRQAFLSWQGVTDLIAGIVDSMYTAAEYDEFITMKYMLAKLILDGEMYSMNIPEATDDTSAKKSVTTVKGISNLLPFLSTAYNRAGVYTFTEKKDQFVIMTAAYNALVDVEVLANAFNMNKAEFMGNQVVIDSFSAMDTARLNELFGNDPWYIPFTQEQITALQTVQLAVVDRDFFMIFDNFYQFTENYNGQGLYWNYFYHTWKTFSSSPFANAVVFTTATPSITSVTVSPATVSLTKGAVQQFTAAVVTTGFAPTTVRWSLPEGSLSTISPEGILTVNPNETETSITVTATSTYDSTKTGTATVTVTA